MQLTRYFFLVSALIVSTSRAHIEVTNTTDKTIKVVAYWQGRTQAGNSGFTVIDPHSKAWIIGDDLNPKTRYQVFIQTSDVSWAKVIDTMENNPFWQKSYNPTMNTPGMGYISIEYEKGTYQLVDASGGKS